LFLPSSQPLFVFAVILNEVKDPDAPSLTTTLRTFLPTIRSCLTHTLMPKLKIRPITPTDIPEILAFIRKNTGAPSMTASSSWVGCKTSAPQVLPLPVPACHSPQAKAGFLL
jgi:hypothetical protein